LLFPPGKWEWDSADGAVRSFTQSGDGFGKVEVFDMSGSSLDYSSVFIKSKWYNDSVKMDDIAPSLAFGQTKPPRDSDIKRQYRNLLAPNDNYAVSLMPVNGSVLLLSDMPGCIIFDPYSLTFEKAITKNRTQVPFDPYADPHLECKADKTMSFKDEPGLPLGMIGAFGSAHPLYTGSSLDG